MIFLIKNLLAENDHGLRATNRLLIFSIVMMKKIIYILFLKLNIPMVDFYFLDKFETKFFFKSASNQNL